MRYIGSKILLLEEIQKIIQDNVKNAESFCDIFSGTSVVARFFKKEYQVLSNDLLHFSYVLQKATIENNSYPEFNLLKKLIKKDPFDYFSEIKISEKDVKQNPFIYLNYSPAHNSERQYFSEENSLKIDYIRQTIEEWFEEQLISEKEYYYLLAGLIEGVPFISNIAGTYGAFLKHWDHRANKTIELVKLDTIDNSKKNECYNDDANSLIRSIQGDILYIDPPYNSRQYAPNYHILETISRYDNPIIYGKTGMRPYNDLKSKYCLKNEVVNTFSDLIENANFKHIILSYSTEGIMGVNDIENILNKYGNPRTYKCKEIPYRRYKHRAGNVEHNLHELLFYIEKEI